MAFDDRAATKADIAVLESRMLKAAIGIVVATVVANAGVTFVLLKLAVGGGG